MPGPWAARAVVPPVRASPAPLAVCSVGTALPAGVKSCVDATHWVLPPAWTGFSLGADASEKTNPPGDGILHREGVVWHRLVVPLAFTLNAG